MRRIFLIGYMASGKTTLGKAFSKATGLQFIDLDWYIESRMHKTISEIFAERGEDGFREVEKRMLHEVGEFEDVLIAAGGGTPCFFDNMEYMNRQGTVVYLKCSPEVLFRHLKMGKGVRPLLLGKNDEELMDFITEQLKKREEYYLKANSIVDVTLMESPDKIALTVDRVKDVIKDIEEQ